MSDNDHENLGSTLHDVDQYLSFIMAGEEYAVNILDVVEIRCIEKMTPLPTAPVYVKGLINLRGTIVPIMDLRQRFNMPQIDYTSTTVIIILQSALKKSEKILGVVVDAISDVYHLSKTTMKDTPDLVGGVSNEYISGLATIDKEDRKKMVVILNVDRLIDVNDVSELVAEAAHEQ